MLNRRLIGLLALLLSAGLSMSACGGDDEASNNNKNNNNTADATGEPDEDTTDEGDATGGEDSTGEGDTVDPPTGCTAEEGCGEGYTCNVAASVCEPLPTGCDVENPPARCGEVTTEFGPASIVTEFQIAGADPECCFDYNGDDAIDNALSLLGGFANESIQESIDSGSLVLLFEHDGLDDVVNSSPYTLNVWLGEGVEAPVTGPFAIDPASIDQGSFPQAYLPNAQIVDGVLNAGPGTVDISIDLLGAQLGLRISQARIEATVDPASTLEDGVIVKDANPALTGGKLGGVIRVDDLVTAANTFAASSCDCLGLDGADYVLANGLELSCAPTPNSTCTEAENSACAGLGEVCGYLGAIGILVDVDTDGDGAVDALSIGTTFNTDAAQISGFAAAE